MGKRGPAPAPSALKALAGVPTSPMEPQPDAGELRRPDGLSSGAAAVWDRLAPDLERKRVLSPWDVDAFAVYCVEVDRFDRAMEKVYAEGEVVEAPVFNRNGEVTGARLVQNPWLAVAKSAEDVLLRYGARFGLTPSDRAQLKVGDGRQANAKERFLS